jgi:hypothetical protein
MEERFEELAALNALGMLEGDEKRTLDGVIVRDHALKTLCTELEATVAELAGAVTPFAPPPALKGRIRAKIRSRRTGAAKHSGNYWAFTGWLLRPPWPSLPLGFGWSVKSSRRTSNPPQRLSPRRSSVPKKLQPTNAKAWRSRSPL